MDGTTNPHSNRSRLKAVVQRHVLVSLGYRRDPMSYRELLRTVRISFRTVRISFRIVRISFRTVRISSMAKMLNA